MSQDLSSLTAMGFGEEQATAALQISDGDIGRAISLLLDQGATAAPAPAPAPAPAAATTREPFAARDDERALQQALEASRVEAEAAARRAPAPAAAPATRAPFAARDDERSLQRAIEASRLEAESAAARARVEAEVASRVSSAMQATTTPRTQPPPAAAAKPAAAAPQRPGAAGAAQARVLAAAEARMAGGGGGGRPAASDSAPRAAAAAAPRAPPPPRIDLTGGGGGGGGGAALAPTTSAAEEKVRQCANRLAGRARAVDVLIGSMAKVIAHPTEEKFRHVNPKNPAFASTVGATPGGIEFLMAVGYEPMHGQLVLQRKDVALLWLGKAELERVRETSTAYAEIMGDLVSRRG